MDAESQRWYFDEEEWKYTPSIAYGVGADEELSHRQYTAEMIARMGRMLVLSERCANTAIVYMHRFYMCHPILLFPGNAMAAACVLVACKEEEQQRSTTDVLAVQRMCLERQDGGGRKRCCIGGTALLAYEELLLKTLGFDLTVEHAHEHLLRACSAIGAGDDLVKAAYFVVTDGLRSTVMCVRYPPAVIACFAVHVACYQLRCELDDSPDGRPWYVLMEPTVTAELLEQLMDEFYDEYFRTCPLLLKRRLRTCVDALSGLDGLRYYLRYRVVPMFMLHRPGVSREPRAESPPRARHYGILLEPFEIAFFANRAAATQCQQPPPMSAPERPADGMLPILQIENPSVPSESDNADREGVEVDFQEQEQEQEGKGKEEDEGKGEEFDGEIDQEHKSEVDSEETLGACSEDKWSIKPDETARLNTMTLVRSISLEKQLVSMPATVNEPTCISPKPLSIQRQIYNFQQKNDDTMEICTDGENTLTVIKSLKNEPNSFVPQTPLDIKRQALFPIQKQCGY